MPGDATFGDFWAGSAARLVPDGRPPGAAAGPGQAEAAAASLRHLVSVLARYLGRDGAWWLSLERPGPWATALAEGRYAISQAGESLAACQHLRQEAGPGEGTPAGDIAAAAGTLRMARDLLSTHFAVRPDGRREDLSDWAAVIATPAVSRALLAVLAAHARAAAVRVSALPFPPGGAREAAAVACRWLRLLDSAVQAAYFADPVPDSDLRLLEAIPVNGAPSRRLPTGTEKAAELAAGMIGTAQSVRRVAWGLASRARWSPGVNAASMRQVAAACTVTSDNCEVILTSLTGRAAEMGFPALRGYLAEAASGAADARRAWLAAARAWDQMTTDSLALISPVAVAAGDMALWSGRLAYADPGWTPRRGPSGVRREPALLAPDRAGLATAVAAVHHAAVALARLGEAGTEQVKAAHAAGRLYVPTRSLPDTYDVPRRLAMAPQSRVNDTVRLYAEAAGASGKSLLAAETVADMTGAPSQVLSLAARAVRRPEARAPSPWLRPPAGAGTARSGTIESSPAAGQAAPELGM